MLRDRLVCGVQNERIQKSLLAQPEDKLDLKRTVELAQSMQLAGDQAKMLSASTSTMAESNTTVNAFKKKQAQRLNRPTWSNQRQTSARSSSTQQQKPRKPCGNCGTFHKRRECPAYGKTCHKCNKKNHYADYCRSSRHVYTVNPDSYSEEDEPAVDEQELFYVRAVDNTNLNLKHDIHATLVVNNTHVPVQLDTGARCNVLPMNVYNVIAPPKSIDNSKSTKLIAYGGTELHTVGLATLPCRIDSSQTEHNIDFHIVDTQVKAILGLTDCLRLGLLSVNNLVYHVSNDTTSPQVFKDYEDLFDSSLGSLPVIYTMTIDPNATPVVRPPRRIPAAMQDKVKSELQRMTTLGVITPVSEPTDWVSSMVATHKKNSEEIRLCIDPRDLNGALKRPHHPTRTVEEVAAKMDGATVFSVLDAKCSFWQIPLDYESSLLTTFSTPYGRYRYLRMPYGLCSASDVYQRTMEQIFADLPCSIIVDDILVGGRTKEEHDRNLKTVLDRIRKINMRLNPTKCRFGLEQVSYVGHVFTASGLKPDPAKVSAITDMPPPTDVTALQRFLGMVTYLAKFVPNLSDLTAPLRELTHSDIHWCWLEQHNAAFLAIKDKIANAPTLMYFDVRKPVTLTCDASKFGLGTACLQEGAPVAYASRTMSDTEQRYAQIEKELLAVVFACTKFHDYIYGKDIVVETDHQPLVTIVKKPLLSAPARLQRMLLRLQRYNITLVYKKGKELFLADTLSRAPLTTTGTETDDLQVMTLLPISDMRLEQLKKATACDSAMQQLTVVISRGWPSHINNAPPKAHPYFAFRDELALDRGIILKGHKAIIPKSLRAEYIQILHEGHPGIEATKRRARDVVYWPSMCLDIEQSVSGCTVCNATKAHQQKEPLKSYPPPSLPWEHIGVDLFHWNGMDYLALGDSYSGWFDFASLDNTCASTVIEVLKRQFSIHGIPRIVISDNARQFDCFAFKQFAQSWGFQHTTSSPHFPQSNGLAESSVKRAKQLLEKTKRDGSDLYRNLLNIRNVPTNPQLGSPSQRLMSRRLRTTIPTPTPLLKPAIYTRVTAQLRKRQQQQKSTYDKSAKPLRPLKPGQVVRLQSPKGHDQLGIVQKHSRNPRSYIVNAQGTLYRRNRRHLLPVPEPPPQQQHSPDFYLPPQDPLPQPAIPHAPPPQPVLTRSGRISKPNPKYMYT
ncbi:uncharacterized protein K02A2.6-like [Patiria miniata]|uniref:RNA-directed DNA polymerase n=2 Tax=Patiria miniata TaxID=46514 RepID=A0A913ZAB4_PATMI|nr:uncharacterized protein K02A2.6-like [Patiria miniata]